MSLPRATPPRRIGTLLVHGTIAEGRRAAVWWAETDTGPVALRVPRPRYPRPRFDAEQREAYGASGRRGDLRPEGALEPLIRGDNLAQILSGAEKNGPVGPEDIAVLLHGVLSELVEHVRGHGDLMPAHVLIGEAGTVRLIDASPDGAQIDRPGRSAYLSDGTGGAGSSDRRALAVAFGQLWAAARAPDERPPPWWSALSKPSTELALEALERSFGPIGLVEAAERRARLVARLCPERRDAWAELAEAALASSRRTEEPLGLDVTIVDAPRPGVEPAPSRGSDASVAAAVTAPEDPTEDRPRSASPAQNPEPIPWFEPPRLELEGERNVPTRIMVRRRAEPPQPSIEDAPASSEPPELDSESSVGESSVGESLVAPVPESELAAERLDQMLAATLTAVAVGLVGLVVALAIEIAWPLGG